MKVSWQVQRHPLFGPYQTTEVDNEELLDCDTEEEKEQLIKKRIQEEFEKNIHWFELSRSDI